MSIIILDDHKLIRDGLKLMLESIEYPKYSVSTCKDIIEAKDLLLYNKVDIAFVDFKIGDQTGDKFVSFVTKEYPEVKCIAISGYDESDYIYRMLQAGAKAYIIKNISEVELNKCIEAVWSGKNYYSKEILDSYVLASRKLATAGNAPAPKPTGLQLLSEREIEIIKLIALELTNDEISDFLNISPRTVANHRTSILNKIEARNTVGLIKFAVENKLIE